MDKNFGKIKEYLLELEYSITSTDEKEGIFLVDNEEAGIKNLIIDCEDPILVLEQFLFELKEGNAEIYQSLLKMNRELVHGAFVLDETGKKVIFRDTLQIENIDLNELEGSLNALALLLSEYTNELIDFSKK